MEGLRESNRFAVDFFGYETIARAKVELLFVYQPSKPCQFCQCLGRRSVVVVVWVAGGV